MTKSFQLVLLLLLVKLCVGSGQTLSHRLLYPLGARVELPLNTTGHIQVRHDEHGINFIYSSDDESRTAKGYKLSTVLHNDQRTLVMDSITFSSPGQYQVESEDGIILVKFRLIVVDGPSYNATHCMAYYSFGKTPPLYLSFANEPASVTEKYANTLNGSSVIYKTVAKCDSVNVHSSAASSVCRIDITEFDNVSPQLQQNSSDDSYMTNSQHDLSPPQSGPLPSDFSEFQKLRSDMNISLNSISSDVRKLLSGNTTLTTFDAVILSCVVGFGILILFQKSVRNKCNRLRNRARGRHTGTESSVLPTTVADRKQPCTVAFSKQVVDSD
jgi:hypothetical protein